MVSAGSSPGLAGARLLTAEDLGEHFGVPERLIMEWTHRYGWPHVRVGRTYRWTPEQLEEIVGEHTVTTPSGVEPRIPGQLPGQTRLSALHNGRR